MKVGRPGTREAGILFTVKRSRKAAAKGDLLAGMPASVIKLQKAADAEARKVRRAEFRDRVLKSAPAANERP